MKMVSCFAVAAFLPAVAAPARAQHQHGGDLLIGRSAAGQLRVEFEWEVPTHLQPVTGPLLFGWAGDDPGLIARDEAEPEEDLYLFEPGVHIRFVALSLSPALKAHAPGFADVLDEPGESILLDEDPEHLVHTHLVWHIDSADSAFDPTRTEWELQFQLQDVGTTAYTDSPAYTVLFTNIPEPAALALLGVATLVTRRR